MITLIKVDKPEEKRNYAPIALLYVGGALKKAGYDVKVVHCCIDNLKNEAQQILKDNPLFVGFSVILGWHTTLAAHLSQEIKRQSPNTKIVWGGVHPSLCPELCIKEDYIDIVVIGEGERIIVGLADALKNKKDLNNVSGLMFKHNHKIIRTRPTEIILDLDNECKADWELINVKDYLRPVPAQKLTKTINMITSRGCPYQCGFCYNLNFNKGRFRAHSVGYVVDEVNYLKDNYGVDGLFFFDDNLFADKKRAFEIIKKVQLPYQAEFRIDIVDENMARELSQTRCIETLIGIESGSNRILKLMNKGFAVKQIWRGLEILYKHKIPMGLSFVLGLPTETWKEAQQTIKLIADIHKRFPQVSDTIGVFLPHPGTDLYDLALKHGFKPPEKTEDWNLLDRQHGQLDFGFVKWGSRDLFKYVRKCGKLASFYNKFHIALTKIPINKLYKLANTPEDKLSKVKFNPLDYRFMDWLYNQIQFKQRDKIFRYKIIRNLYSYWRRKAFKND